jgi:hypothetical protein
MSSTGKEEWEVRGETFQRFETVTKKYEVRDDKIQLRLQHIRDFVAQTQGYPAGALIRVGSRHESADFAIGAILAISSNEVPTYSENPHAGGLEEQVP